MASDRYVVDASVVAKWYLHDEGLFVEAALVARDWVTESISLFAPPNLSLELSHTLVRAMRRGRLSPSETRRAVTDFAHVSDRLVFAQTQSLTNDGLALALDLGVGFYDACYLAVARHLRAPFLAADEAFYRQAGGEPDVIWLADYPTLRST